MNHFLSLAAMLCLSLLFSCAPYIEPPPPPNELLSSSDVDLSSSSLSEISSSSSQYRQSSSDGLSSSSLASSGSVAVYSSSIPPPSSSSVTPNSSSAVVSSSSVVISSSSSSTLLPSSSSVVAGVGLCNGFVNGTKREHYGREKEQFCDERDGKKYVYVTIGTQTWMAENMNYNASGSKCSIEIDCTIYGRMYDWATAMELPASCNSNSCVSQISTKHQGICPLGWHIPSDAEWGALMQFVNSSCSSTGECTNAGRLLKAISDWNEGCNGTDAYGFSALPSSSGATGTVWWGASEVNANLAYDRYIDDRYVNDRNDNVRRDPYYKNSLFSVRCLKD